MSFSAAASLIFLTLLTKETFSLYSAKYLFGEELPHLKRASKFEVKWKFEEWLRELDYSDRYNLELTVRKLGKAEFLCQDSHLRIQITKKLMSLLREDSDKVNPDSLKTILWALGQYAIDDEQLRNEVVSKLQSLYKTIIKNVDFFYCLLAIGRWLVTINKPDNNIDEINNLVESALAVSEEWRPNHMAVYDALKILSDLSSVINLPEIPYNHILMVGFSGEFASKISLTRDALYLQKSDNHIVMHAYGRSPQTLDLVKSQVFLGYDLTLHTVESWDLSLRELRELIYRFQNPVLLTDGIRCRIYGWQNGWKMTDLKTDPSILKDIPKEGYEKVIRSFDIPHELRDEIDSKDAHIPRRKIRNLPSFSINEEDQIIIDREADENLFNEILSVCGFRSTLGQRIGLFLQRELESKVSLYRSMALEAIWLNKTIIPLDIMKQITHNISEVNFKEVENNVINKILLNIDSFLSVYSEKNLIVLEKKLDRLTNGIDLKILLDCFMPTVTSQSFQKKFRTEINEIKNNKRESYRGDNKSQGINRNWSSLPFVAPRPDNTHANNKDEEENKNIIDEYNYNKMFGHTE